MNFEDIKFYSINIFTIFLSFSQLDPILKTSLLLISVGYGIDKWRRLYKDDKDDK